MLFPRYLPNSLGKRHPHPSASASPSPPPSHARGEFHSPRHHQPLLSDHSVAGFGDVIPPGSVFICPPPCVSPKSHCPAASFPPSLATLPHFSQPNFKHPSHHHNRSYAELPNSRGGFSSRPLRLLAGPSYNFPAANKAPEELLPKVSLAVKSLVIRSREPAAANKHRRVVLGPCEVWRIS